MVIGVLALQGAFAKQAAMLHALGEKALEVRQAAELAQCRALIIPGGESTAILKQLHRLDLVDAITAFSKEKPLFGICAGLILLSRVIVRDPMQPLGIFDLVIERNAYGRQNDSFQTEIKGCMDEKSFSFPAAFIRAPQVRETGASVKILACHNGSPVLIQQGRHLGATFHPELTENPSIHAYFLRNAREARL